MVRVEISLLRVLLFTSSTIREMSHSSIFSSPLANDADFIALPVGGGDAFLLRRGSDVVLIDGGNPNSSSDNGRSFPEMVEDNVVGNELDVVICTHNDSDHSGGILSLLNDPEARINIGELWLPLHWTENMINLVADPGLFLTRLIEDYAEEGLIEQGTDFDHELGGPDFWGWWKEIPYRQELKHRSVLWNEETRALLGQIVEQEGEIGDLFESAISFNDQPARFIEPFAESLRRYGIDVEADRNEENLSLRIGEALALKEKNVEDVIC